MEKRKLLSIALLLTLGPGAVAVERHLQKRQRASQSVNNRYYLPAPRVIRGLSFGYQQLAADALWVRTIGYFANHLTTDRDMRHLHRYLDAILALDPYFKAVYRYGASMLTTGRNPVPESARLQAVALLERATRYFPNEHRFALALGIRYMSDLKGKNAAERKRYRLRGASWIKRAVLLGAKQPWLPLLAAQIYTKQGELQMAIHHLNEMYLVARDKSTRDQIISKLRHLQQLRVGAKLRSEGARMRRAHRMSAIPYVSADLFALIEQEPERPFTLGPR